MNYPQLPFRIGVLVPSSNFISLLASDLLTAIKFGLEQAGLKAELIIESAGYNADSYLVIPKLQQLMLAQNVACLIAPLNVAMIEKLAPHCASNGVPLIALNLTEDPLYNSAKNPFVFVNSFHLWHCAWLGGYLAAQRFGPRGASAVGLHEGGYGLSFAFQLGMEAAQGSLARTVITHKNSTQEDPTAEIAALAEAEPDFIWAGYSGKEAISFLTAYQNSTLKNRVPLIGLAPLVNAHVRKMATAAVQDIWFVTASLFENSPEKLATEQPDDLTQTLGRAAHPYAVLGYESAHLIAQANQLANQTEAPQIEFPAALRQVFFDGNRGRVRFDADEIPPLNFTLRQVTAAADTTEAVTAPALLHEQYQLAQQRLTKQGWVNPYLCA